MEKLADIFKILQDTKRLRILSLLSQQKMCVCELAHILGVTQPSVSRHLKKMKEAGLLLEEQDSFWTNYSLCKCEGRNQEIVNLVLNWLNSEEVVKRDFAKLGKIDRTKICC